MKPKKLIIATVGLLLTILVLYAVHPFILTQIGGYLVVEQPLEKADAIVFLSGPVPYPAMEAADLYKQGWAKEVWLTRAAYPAGEAALEKLGVDVPKTYELNQQVLKRLGVPRAAIPLLIEPVENSANEVRAIAAELRRVKGNRVILVTLKSYSRRILKTWQTLAGSSPTAIVRYAQIDPFDADAWWRTTGGAFTVVREALGLLNIRAGLPLSSYRGG